MARVGKIGAVESEVFVAGSGTPREDPSGAEPDAGPGRADGWASSSGHPVAGAQEGEERYRAVVEQAGEGILLVNVDDRRVLEANASYRDLLGYAPEEMLGLTLYDLVPYPRESMDCYVERVVESGSYVSGERRHLRKDGSLVDVEVSANTVLAALASGDGARAGRPERPGPGRRRRP